METIKKLEEITGPDCRSTCFGVLNVSDGTTRAVTLADFYRDAERIHLNETAPEDVRSYMEAVKTLFVYGWFYYPFFTLSAFMATTAVEMALNAKLRKGAIDSPGLKKLFDQAIREGLLRDENFPSREHVRAHRVLAFGGDSETRGGFYEEGNPPYPESVPNLMRHFRNVFAHPSGHWILFPGQSLDFLVLAAELINQPLRM